VVYGAIPLPDACKNDVFGLKKAGKWLMQREVNCYFFIACCKRPKADSIIWKKNLSLGNTAA
jgi:hypothetical protein